MWRIQQHLEGTPFLNLSTMYRLRGPLDVGALEGAVVRVANRQHLLATVFEDGSATLRLDRAPVLRIVDASGADVQRLTEIYRTESSHAFDFARPEALLRPLLVRLGPEEHALILVLHQLVCDGRSLTVIVEDLADAYAAELGGPEPDPLEAQYYEVATEWEKRADAAWRYWQSRLRDLRKLNIGASRELDAATFADFHFRSSPWSEELGSALREHCRSARTTPFVATATAVFASLANRLGVRDLRLVTMFLNRITEREHPLVAPLSQGLLVRVEVRPEDTFATLEGRVRRNLVEAIANRAVAFDEIVDYLHAQGMARRDVGPLWLDVVEPPPTQLPPFGRATTERFPLTSDEPPGTTLNLFLEQEAGAVRVTAAANAATFSESELADLAADFACYLALTVEDGSRLVADASGAEHAAR